MAPNMKVSGNQFRTTLLAVTESIPPEESHSPRLFAGLFNDLVAAAEDDKVSEEEFQKIVAKAKKVAAQVEE